MAVSKTRKVAHALTLPRTRRKVKNLFSSLTFWTILLLLFTSITPKLEEMAEKGYGTITDWVKIAEAISITGLTILARYSEDDTKLYTSKFVLGRDKAEAEAEIAAEVNQSQVLPLNQSGSEELISHQSSSDTLQ